MHRTDDRSVDPAHVRRQFSVRAGAGVFAVGFAIHQADHVRRGLAGIPEGVVWAGTMLAVIAAVALTLIVTNHPSAPTAATAVGFATAFGVTAAHLLPSWGSLSDSLPDGHVDAFTWFAVLAEIASGLVLGLAGLAALRQRWQRGQ